jgi:hypothetical protein
MARGGAAAPYPEPRPSPRQPGLPRPTNTPSCSNDQCPFQAGWGSFGSRPSGEAAAPSVAASAMTSLRVASWNMHRATWIHPRRFDTAAEHNRAAWGHAGTLGADVMLLPSEDAVSSHGGRCRRYRGWPGLARIRECRDPGGVRHTRFRPRRTCWSRAGSSLGTPHALPRCAKTLVNEMTQVLGTPHVFPALDSRAVDRSGSARA